jgi:protease IV
MKSFFKMMFASFFGGILLLLVIFLIISVMIGGMVKSFGQDDEVKLEKNTVIRLNLNYDLPERSIDDAMPSFGPFGIEKKNAIGLNDVVTYINHAATDNKIKGIYLQLGNNPNGMATLEEIRGAMKSFRNSGKFIVAYGEFMNEKSYYLGSLADEIYLNPSGLFEFNGFVAQLSFYKNMLDKLGIKFRVFYAGKFKSATEPIRATKMSDANRLQLREYLNSVYNHYISNISADIGVSPESLIEAANKLSVINPLDAKAAKMITDVWYDDQVKDRIRELCDNRKEGDTSKIDMHYISFKNYRTSVKSDVINYEENKIAVVFAEGIVNSGKGQDGTIGSNTYAKTFRKLRENKNVKAVVIRVNSPGGVSIAGDVIWREIKLTAKKKPVVVSIGDLGASAAYLISAPGKKIFAQPNSITGSIGVFMMMPVMEEFFEDKIGINWDTVRTGEYADILNINRDVTDYEAQVIQRMINISYADFIVKVGEGRNMDTSKVAELAQGRIWSGMQARENGLIDELGGLKDAIQAAAEMAGIDEYMVRNYPKQEKFIDKLLSSFESSENLDNRMQTELGPLYLQFKQIQELLNQKDMQSRMPYQIEIK